MTITHPLAEDYIRQLEHAARVLPRGDRDELVDQIRSHIAAGMGPDATEADVRNVLDELGPPEAIVAAAHPGRPPERRGAREALALAFLVVGFPPVLGWVVGLVLLLVSPLWNARQKLLGALVWPGGLLMVGAFPLLFVARSETCVSSGSAVQVCEPGQVCPVSPILDNCASSGIQWGVVLLAVVLVLAPIVVAAYLWRRRRPAVGYFLELSRTGVPAATADA